MKLIFLDGQKKKKKEIHDEGKTGRFFFSCKNFIRINIQKFQVFHLFFLVKRGSITINYYIYM